MLICKAFTTIAVCADETVGLHQVTIVQFITICKPIKQIAKHHGVFGNFITDGERPGVLLRKGKCKFNN